MAKGKLFSGGLFALLLALALTSPMASAARNDRGNNNNSNGDEKEQIWLRKEARQRNSGNESNDAAVRQREQRLSPEERLQLRRDIRDAGREIYLRRR